MPTTSRRAALCLALMLSLGARRAAAQDHQPAALPTAEQVLAAYYEASGGLDRLATLRDVTFEWRTAASGRVLGNALSRRMAPGSLREEMPGGAANASNPRLSWRRRPDGTVTVDSTAGSARSRLQAALEASYLVGLAEQGITARVTAVDSVDGERAYRVEFRRGDAMRAYLFGARSGMPLRILVDERQGVFIRYTDYRPVNGFMEPHRVEITNGSPANTLLFELVSARHNTGLTEAVFLPPTTGAAAP